MPTPSSAGLLGLTGLLDLSGHSPALDPRWIGRRCVDDVDLPGHEDDGPVLVTVTGGAGQVIGAARAAADRDAVLLVPLRDLDDMGGNARRVCAAAAGVVEEERLLLGLPAGEPRGGWLAAADEAAACGYGLALRSAGPAGPLPVDVVVDLLEAALDRECPVHWRGPHPLLPGGSAAEGTGHPALALLLATAAAWDGDDPRAVLNSDAAALLAAATARETAQPGDLARARRWCRGVGVDATAVAAEIAARPELSA